MFRSIQYQVFLDAEYESTMLNSASITDLKVYHERPNDEQCLSGAEAVRMIDYQFGLKFRSCRHYRIVHTTTIRLLWRKFVFCNSFFNILLISGGIIVPSCSIKRIFFLFNS